MQKIRPVFQRNMSLIIKTSQSYQFFLAFQNVDEKVKTKDFSNKLFLASASCLIESSMETFKSLITEKYEFEYRD